MAGNSTWEILLVVSPLQALREDQISSCSKKGLNCVKLEEIKAECSANIIFTSPEIMEKNSSFLVKIQDRILGVVVDKMIAPSAGGHCSLLGTSLHPGN